MSSSSIFEPMDTLGGALYNFFTVLMMVILLVSYVWVCVRLGYLMHRISSMYEKAKREGRDEFEVVFRNTRTSVVPYEERAPKIMIPDVDNELCEEE